MDIINEFLLQSELRFVCVVVVQVFMAILAQVQVLAVFKRVAYCCKICEILDACLALSPLHFALVDC